MCVCVCVCDVCVYMCVYVCVHVCVVCVSVCVCVFLASRNLESLGSSSECYSSLQLCEFFVGNNADIFLQLSSQGADAAPPLTQVKPTPEETCSVGKLFAAFHFHCVLAVC